MEVGMARRRFAMQPEPQSRLLLTSVRCFVRSLVEDVSNGRSPSIALERYRTYCSDPLGNCACSSDTPFAKDFISIDKHPQAAHRLAGLLRVLSIVQQLLQQNKHASKRDIFYMDPALFVDQAVVDHIISDICILLKCSRHHLNVVPVGKGLVMGWLRFKESGRTVSCIKNPNADYPIPVCLEDVEDIVSVAQYILVVEKETVFQRLANDKFCDRNRCIVVTGRGYPDVPTRRFLRYLVEQLCLPVYCLVDSDPYGFDILTTYRFGSTQMAYDAKLMRVPEMRWLGVLPSDFEEFNLPDRCLLNLTPEDKRKVEAMLSRCYLHKKAPQWRTELIMMLHKGVKFEIEALSAISFAFLSEVYIPTKIEHGRHI
ncbi:Meiotic recombination protein SPO11-2 [Rhynchospora pubera]|uniref:DNA topoisomerase (ATP-hydrolyzing) n=1 Tax=Rhynchospora pubera TaxID=906938 RepID=A0AAV8AU04_9POAL|nr:Meiotic recombination protein SPO11-2 [Rhynchospora pubera]KAJ4800936.1 Meiotic recombination protein SPO11-2 [Rhynchospora pubera]